MTETFDQELLGDLVGVASTRLAAAGVPRPNRVRAMRMLALLSTVADAALLVRQPVHDVAAEFDFPLGEVRSAVDALVEIGVVHHEGPLLRLSARETAVGGMRLVDFVELTEPPRRRSAATVVMRPAVAFAAAGILLASGTLVGARIVGKDAGDQGTSYANAATTDKHFPHGQVPGALPAIDVPDDAQLPVSVTSTSLTLISTCPSRSTSTPMLVVTGSTPGADGMLSVEGTATNPSPAAVEISGFTLYVSPVGQGTTLSPVATKLTVPPGGSVRWQERIALRAPAGTPATVTLDGWNWADQALRATCPV